MEPRVAWMPWGPATFALAQKERRPIYVNVAAGWCHWCHVMDATTLSDALVVDLLAKEFVAIRVDQDERPDVAERYQDWGWPANIILTPEAQPWQELRGFQAPDEFRTTLAQAVKSMRKGKPRARPDAAAAPRIPLRGPVADLQLVVRSQLDSFFDPKAGGWGTFQKYPHAAPIEEAFLRWRRRGDEPAKERALLTLQGMRHLVDPVWGGMYQYSVNHGWTEPHYEKIAAVQASALKSFTRGWLATGDAAWLEDARSIRDYLARRLRLPGGAFAASEDADAQTATGLVVEGATFYGRSAAGRRSAAPRRDERVPADANGLLVKALAVHFDATQERESLDLAIAAQASLDATHRLASGAYIHGVGTPLVHLRDNAAVGRALVALADSTGDLRLLHAAEKVALVLMSELEAEEGGFYASTPEPEATGVFRERRKPVEDNGMAVRLLTEVAARTEDEELAIVLRIAAEKAVRSLGVPDALRGEAQLVGNFLLAMEAVVSEPTHIVVAGRRGDPASEELYAAALRLDVFGKTVRWARPGEYPPTAAYVCRGSACSPPARDRHALRRELLGPDP